MGKLYTLEDLNNAFEAGRALTHRPKYFGSNPKGTSDDYWDQTYPTFKDYYNKCIKNKKF